VVSVAGSTKFRPLFLPEGSMANIAYE